MSREFSLVLLGSGVLTAGFFAAPSADAGADQKADEKAAARTGYPPGHVGGGHGIIWIHTAGYGGYGANGRPMASPGVSRGGFGGIGHAAGAGG